ncbi:MAG TPA: hypothetical protein VFO91_10670, partial [Anaerolineales bacterium]|nr:hypothetical protein [Anaerolineales bacterium]
MLYLILASALSLSFTTYIPPAQGESPGGEFESGAVVCAPGAYLEAPGDCLPLGPSIYITEMARLGLTF